MSDNTDKRDNQVKSGDRGPVEGARPNRVPARDGYRNQQRRSGSGSQDKTARAQGDRTINDRDNGGSRSAQNFGNRDVPRKDFGPDGQRRGVSRPVQTTAREGGVQNRTTSQGGNKHITRDIRPEDAAQNQNSGNRDNRNKVNHSNFDKRVNRNDQRPEKRAEPKTWGRNIRTEETSEEIRKDNERIEKDIWLEIAGIHTMKLD